MEFELYEHVHDSTYDIDGVVIDSYADENGQLWYIVEGDTAGLTDDAYPGEWPLYDCLPESLTRI